MSVVKTYSVESLDFNDTKFNRRFKVEVESVDESGERKAIELFRKNHTLEALLDCNLLFCSEKGDNCYTCSCGVGCHQGYEIAAKNDMIKRVRQKGNGIVFRDGRIIFIGTDDVIELRASEVQYNILLDYVRTSYNKKLTPTNTKNTFSDQKKRLYEKGYTYAGIYDGVSVFIGRRAEAPNEMEFHLLDKGYIIVKVKRGNKNTVQDFME